MVLTNIAWDVGTKEAKQRAKMDLINAEMSSEYIAEHAKFLR